MSKVEPTIWMNVTTSSNWNRPAVGIVRVEKSLAAELKNIYSSKFKCCVWSQGEFIEWHSGSKNDCSLNIEKTQLNEEKQAPELIYPVVGKEQALAYIAQGLLSLMPKRFTLWFSQALFWARPRIGKWLQKKSLPEQAKPNTYDEPKIQKNGSKIFKENDIFISVGLDWDHEYYKEFYNLRKKQKLKIVTCCYDLIPVLYPQYCVGEVSGIFTSYFLEIADASDLVLCISKQSERDFVKLLDRTGGASPQTLVFPLGDNVTSSLGNNVSEDVNSIIDGRFILFVSSIERRKNHEVLYRAYHLLCADGKRESLPKLVFVGMQGWGVNDLMQDIQLDPLTQGLIVQLNHVSDAELSQLYKAALFCVFPSLYEGWGLPVGEALSMGKVVISSARGSLPEVGGDLVRYVDPWDPRAWATEIYKISNDDLARKELEKHIKERYSSRTWKMSALAISEGVEKIIERNLNSNI